jgi:hypothetical protein
MNASQKNPGEQERITLGQARRWRDDNERLTRELAELRDQVAALQARSAPTPPTMAATGNVYDDGTFSLIAALAVWFFGGAAGAHRFYIKDWVPGYFLLASLLGIPFTWLFAVIAGWNVAILTPLWLLWAGLHALFVLIDGICLFFDKRARR